MKIGIITYNKYEERVLIDEHFFPENLFKIMLNDTDFVKFQIIGENQKLILSTQYKETGKKVIYLQLAHLKREVEILGTTFNAYNTPAYVYKTKVTWTVNSGIYKTRKEARKYADLVNLKARLLLEKFIYQNNHQNKIQ